MVMITLYVRQQKRHRCIEQSFGLCGRGQGGMIWENGIETCRLSCKKWSASLCLIQDTGCLGLVHWDDPERWYGVGGGRGVQDWELMYTRGGFMSMYGKNNTVLSLKKLKIKIKIWMLRQSYPALLFSPSPSHDHEKYLNQTRESTICEIHFSACSLNTSTPL